MVLSIVNHVAEASGWGIRDVHDTWETGLKTLKSEALDLSSHVFQKQTREPDSVADFLRLYRPYLIWSVVALLLFVGYTFFLIYVITRKSREIRKAYKKLSQEVEIHRQTSQKLMVLSLLVEQSQFGILLMRNDGCVLFLNPAAEEFLGVHFSDVQGALFDEIVEMDPRLMQEMLFAARNGQHWSGQMTLKSANDEDALTLELSAFAVRNGDQEILYHALIMSDISREIKLEKKLAEKQKLELVGQLAGGVAHDFNNSLTVIKGSAELLTWKSANEDVRRLSSDIVKASDHAGALVSQLLGFSRRQMIKPEFLDVTMVLTDMMHVLHRLVPEDIRLTADFAPGLLPVKADAMQLNQVLTNLVTNARDAIRESQKQSGGQYIEVFTRVEKVDETMAASMDVVTGDYVVFEVRDSGPGVPDEMMTGNRTGNRKAERRCCSGVE